MGGAADMHRRGGAGDKARARRAHMVGIDVEPDTILGLAIQAQAGGATAQRLRQQHRRAAVQDAMRLHRAAVHRHACTERSLADLGELDAQLLDSGVLVAGK